MDDNIKLSGVYTTTFISNENNYESSNGTTNDVWWGENGVAT